jgi:hypothetical protein
MQIACALTFTYKAFAEYEQILKEKLTNKFAVQ